MELYNTIYEVITELIRDNKLFKMHITKLSMFIIGEVNAQNEATPLKLLKAFLKDHAVFFNNFFF